MNELPFPESFDCGPRFNVLSIREQPFHFSPNHLSVEMLHILGRNWKIPIRRAYLTCIQLHFGIFTVTGIIPVQFKTFSHMYARHSHHERSKIIEFVEVTLLEYAFEKMRCRGELIAFVIPWFHVLQIVWCKGNNLAYNGRNTARLAEIWPPGDPTVPLQKTEQL